MVRPLPRAQLLYYQDRMRALGISGVPGLLLAGSAVPEHSDPGLEVSRILWTNFSPEPRSDKRVHFGLGFESRAKFLEIRWASGTFQTPENVSRDQVLEIDGAVPR